MSGKPPSCASTGISSTRFADPDVTVRLSRHDFLRVVTNDLDFQEGIAAGRIQVKGDSAMLAKVFANRI